MAVIPRMTSNTSGGNTITCSYNNNSLGRAWHAFDTRTTSTLWNGYNEGAWIQIQLKTALTVAAILLRIRNKRKFRIQAWRNGVLQKDITTEELNDPANNGTTQFKIAFACNFDTLRVQSASNGGGIVICDIDAELSVSTKATALSLTPNQVGPLKFKPPITQQFTPQVTPADATGYTISYSLSHPKAATITNKGLLTVTHLVPKLTITATLKNKDGSTLTATSTLTFKDLYLILLHNIPHYYNPTTKKWESISP